MLSPGQFQTDACPTCKGKGSNLDEHEEEGHDRVRVPCDDCSGSGRVPKMSQQDLAGSRSAYQEGRRQRYADHVASGKHDSVCGGGPSCRWKA
jgi:DnaJ-class molecular chaperone